MCDVIKDVSRGFPSPRFMNKSIMYVGEHERFVGLNFTAASLLI